MPHFLDQSNALLGGISPNKFMTEFWQKKPYLIRQAIPDYQCPITPEVLFDYASLDDVESRLVQKKQQQWSMTHGPFRRLPQRQLPDWTLLVQGVNAIDHNMAALIDRFRFIPNIRLDDIMISYATLGGGVGAHFDSYDVFLLQGKGQREWRIGPLKTFDLVEDSPVKLLKNFVPTETYHLAAGDMLYLPPRWGHDGIAVSEDCITISIGFRTPIAYELQIAALECAIEELQAQGQATILPEMYTDPQQMATSQPGEIPSALVHYTQQLLQKIQWDDTFAARVLGTWFSEPKPNIFFDSPAQEWHAVPAPFTLELPMASILLYTQQQQFFMNGERFAPLSHPLFYTLADARSVLVTTEHLASLSEHEQAVLADWYEAGWITKTAV